MDQSQIRLSAGPRVPADGTTTTQPSQQLLATESHRPSSPPAAHSSGQRFRVDRLIAEGGMGSVFRGWHLSLNQPIAIKVLNEVYWNHSLIEALFLQEARLGARLRGSHVPRVLDFGRWDVGGPYIVSELLDGTDLRALLRDTRNADTTVESILHLFLSICDAVGSVHAQGVVHRDLKPSNLFLATEAGLGRCVKVLDFGIAKPPDGTDPFLAKDLGGGSPAYVAPEQLKAPSAVDFRADIWSLGVVLYEMLTGEPPFVGETNREILMQVLANDVEPPSRRRLEVSTKLDQIVLSCLSTRPEQRPASVDALKMAVLGELGRIDDRASVEQQRRAPIGHSIGETWDTRLTRALSKVLSSISF